MNAYGVGMLAVSVVGWCLVHFIWQAGVVGALYALVRWVLPRGNPRYLAAMLALAAMAAWPVATAWHELAVLGTPGALPGMVVRGRTAIEGARVAPFAWPAVLGAALPWLVLAWAAGVGILGIRVFRQWRGLRRMLRMAQALPVWQARARRFADRLGLRRVVPVLASVRVATPTLVGWVRPAVVLPLAVLARMPAAQIDLILAHELAHLKRFDHFANLFQVVLETLFFYHPVVHWISREARNERELCCDALALRATGGARRDFVAALAGLEELRAGHAELALAASGGILVERAWFVAGAIPAPGLRRRARGNVLLLVALVALLGLGWLGWRAGAWQRLAAAQVSSGNAMLLRLVRAGAVPVLAPVVASSDMTLPRLSAAVADTPASSVPPAPVTIRMVVKPGLALATAKPRLAPLAAAAPIAVPAEDPRPVVTVRPVYPPAELLAGTQGRVAVAFTLDAQGVPRDLDVVGPGAGAFGTAALRALARWRFAPPAVPGRRYRETFTFEIGASTADAAATARPCMVTTGTHICRRVPDADPTTLAWRPRR